MSKGLTNVLADIAAKAITLSTNEPNDQKLGKKVREMVSKKLSELKDGTEDELDRV